MPRSVFPLPGVEHGRRLLPAVIEQRAQKPMDPPWISVPVNEEDLSQGYTEISYKQLNNYANHAAHWLSQNLPPTSEPFQRIAYAGPKDLRYPILEVAAAKLQKVFVLPSPMITAEAQRRILEHTNCTVYLRAASMTAFVDSVLSEAPHVQTVTAPDLEQIMQEAEAPPYVYSKTWDEAKDDPWLVFHTSGTTGLPKPVTFTHRMLASSDHAMSLPNLEPNTMQNIAEERWYTPLPSLHFAGTLMSLVMATFFHMTLVMGPSAPPSSDVMADTIHYGRVDGVLFPPVLLEVLCQSPKGLAALRSLKHINYAGAPLSAQVGEQLAPYTHLAPAIGSTEAGIYFTVDRHVSTDWDYVAFQKHAGAVFEPRFDNLYELVFVRHPDCLLQQIFMLYPDRDRFETNDLWVEHPVHKGLWKVVGRCDDYVTLSHGDGLHASSLEPEIEAHPQVQLALIGGPGLSAPVLLVELVPEANRTDRQQLLASLQPYIDRVNERCHECVKLSPDRLIIAPQDKPFPRTLKGGAARVKTLKLYEQEISDLFPDAV